MHSCITHSQNDGEKISNGITVTGHRIPLYFHQKRIAQAAQKHVFDFLFLFSIRIGILRSSFENEMHLPNNSKKQKANFI